MARVLHNAAHAFTAGLGNAVLGGPQLLFPTPGLQGWKSDSTSRRMLAVINDPIEGGEP